uniref:GRIP domain-containing protein n=1 Tax=Chromera velia CCMP2878 TaxID=1169474 RepID=A0A0G4F3Z4_9ALVE|eukprot:Cvel_14967.t1-p1 / transcript=Cvel_14967.t1 / gene=Cvel_14967 / organism=Chromera_velia_CCMP2878 / gene_product=Flagellar attachment zone protein 1, putative / transcript_product=Flagellar attachment zone protein 1, putative / location=Cvel_scaffold1087:4579-16886(+) / protein_length=1941 / sequence_SO=supercontig / SO=protein_coding / is_pseudo=false
MSDGAGETAAADAAAQQEKNLLAQREAQMKEWGHEKLVNFGLSALKKHRELAAQLAESKKQVAALEASLSAETEERQRLETHLQKSEAKRVSLSESLEETENKLQATAASLQNAEQERATWESHLQKSEEKRAAALTRMEGLEDFLRAEKERAERAEGEAATWKEKAGQAEASKTALEVEVQKQKADIESQTSKLLDLQRTLQEKDAQILSQTSNDSESQAALTSLQKELEAERNLRASASSDFEKERISLQSKIESLTAELSSAKDAVPPPPPESAPNPELIVLEERLEKSETKRQQLRAEVEDLREQLSQSQREQEQRQANQLPLPTAQLPEGGRASDPTLTVRSASALPLLPSAGELERAGSLPPPTQPKAGGASSLLPPRPVPSRLTSDCGASGKSVGSLDDHLESMTDLLDGGGSKGKDTERERERQRMASEFFRVKEKYETMKAEMAELRVLFSSARLQAAQLRGFKHEEPSLSGSRQNSQQLGGSAASASGDTESRGGSSQPPHAASGGGSSRGPIDRELGSLAAQLRDLQADLIHTHNRAVSAEWRLYQLEQETADSESRIQSLDELCEDLTNELDQWKTSHNQAQAANRDLTEETRTLRETLETRERERDALAARLAAEEKQLHAIREDLKSAESRLHDVLPQLASSQRELKTLQCSRDQAEAHHMEERAQAEHTQHQREAQLQEARQRETELRNTVASMTREMASLRHAVDEASCERDALRTHVQTLSEELGKFRTDLDTPVSASQSFTQGEGGPGTTLQGLGLQAGGGVPVGISAPSDTAKGSGGERERERGQLEEADSGDGWGVGLGDLDYLDEDQEDGGPTAEGTAAVPPSSSTAVAAGAADGSTGGRAKDLAEEGDAAALARSVEAQAEIAKLSAENESLRMQVASLRQDESIVREKLSEALERAAETEKRLKDAEATRNAEKSEWETSQGGVAAELSALKSQLEAAKETAQKEQARNEELQEEVQASRTEMERLATAAESSLNDDLESLREQLRRLSSERKKAEDDLASSCVTVDKLRGALEKAQKEAVDKEAAFSRERDEATRATAELKAALESAKEEAAQASALKETLEEECRQARGEARELVVALEAARSEAAENAGVLEEMEIKLAKMKELETALEAKEVQLQTAQTEAAEAAAALERMREEGARKETASGEGETEEGGVESAKEKEQIEQLRTEVQKLNGEKRAIVAKAKERSKQLLEEVEKLRGERDSLKAEVEEKSKQTDREKEIKVEEVENLEKKCTEALKNVQSLESRLSEKDGEIDRLSTQNVKFKELLQKANARMGDNKQNVQELEEKLTDREKEVDSLEKRINALIGHYMRVPEIFPAICVSLSIEAGDEVWAFIPEPRGWSSHEDADDDDEREELGEDGEGGNVVAVRRDPDLLPGCRWVGWWRVADLEKAASSKGAEFVAPALVHNTFEKEVESWRLLLADKEAEISRQKQSLQSLQKEFQAYKLKAQAALKGGAGGGAEVLELREEVQRLSQAVEAAEAREKEAVDKSSEVEFQLVSAERRAEERRRLMEDLEAALAAVQEDTERRIRSTEAELKFSFESLMRDKEAEWESKNDESREKLLKDLRTATDRLQTTQEQLEEVRASAESVRDEDAVKDFRHRTDSTNRVPVSHHAAATSHSSHATGEGRAAAGFHSSLDHHDDGGVTPSSFKPPSEPCDVPPPLPVGAARIHGGPAPPAYSPEVAQPEGGRRGKGRPRVPPVPNSLLHDISPPSAASTPCGRGGGPAASLSFAGSECDQHRSASQAGAGDVGGGAEWEEDEMNGPGGELDAQLSLGLARGGTGLVLADVNEAMYSEAQRLRQEIRRLESRCRDEARDKELLSQQVSKLKEEIRKSDATWELQGLQGNKVSIEYLRSIVKKFVETGPHGSPEHEALVPVLLTLVKIEKDEAATVQAARAKLKDGKSLLGGFFGR